SDTRSASHRRMAAPNVVARTPLVTTAADAPSQTTMGAPDCAAMAAAMIWPGSPHSDVRIAANATRTGLFERSTSLAESTPSGRLNSGTATPRRLALAMIASGTGGSSIKPRPQVTAAPILTMNAAVIPTRTGALRYLVASAPVV